MSGDDTQWMKALGLAAVLVASHCTWISVNAPLESCENSPPKKEHRHSESEITAELKPDLKLIIPELYNFKITETQVDLHKQYGPL